MRPVMRYHGGKFRLATWVMQFFPPHRIYVEPFGGAAGVLIQKPRSESEVYNDLDDDVTNLFRVLQCPESSERLTRLVVLTPYARREFELAYEPTSDPVERARRTLARASMGFGSAGATKQSTGFRIDSAREYGTAAKIWADYPPAIATFCRRLAGVLIENRPALEVIEGHDTPATLFYVDPPYMIGTRVINGGKGRYYNHEMDNADHERLLGALCRVQGMVVLAGYDTDLYNDILRGWARFQTEARISAARGTGKRVETLWINPATSEGLGQKDLFA